MIRQAFWAMTIAISLGAADLESVMAQSYPSRPVQLIVPFSGGASIDILARGLAEGLSAELGQPTVVVNERVLPVPLHSRRWPTPPLTAIRSHLPPRANSRSSRI